MDGATYTVTAEVWLYPGEAGWHFVTLPPDVADDVRARSGASARPFGSVPARITIGGMTWSTSLLATAAEAAKALSDPTRLAVAAALRDGGELCVCDLAWVCERSDKLVSHHVRQLRAAGLARSRRDGKTVMYELTEAGVTLLSAVLPAVRA